jgi:hypothetical protein
MKLRLIGAAALSLVLATPAMAMQHRHHHYGYVHKEPSVQDAPRLGYGSSYGAYNYYPEDEFAPDNPVFDFDRRNTFN